MAIRRSYSAPPKSNEPTTFVGKYSLKNKAGLSDVGNEAYVLPLDMANGYVEIPYHNLKKCADGTGFKGSTFASKIACHKYDKNTGEVVDQLPLCCRLAQAEKDRLNDKEKSVYRALSFTSRRNVIPVMVLSTTETDSSKKPSLKKVSIKNGVEFSFIDMSESAYNDLANSIKEAMETEGIIENPEEMDPEELAIAIAEYIQGSVIKISNITARTKGIKYERAFRAIPIKNPMVAKESGEQKVIHYLSQVLNDKFPAEKINALYEKFPAIQAINNQAIDFLELFNSEVDSIVTDWFEDELQSYYDTYLEKQGVVNAYKSAEPAKAIEETVTFNNTTTNTTSNVSDDFDFEVEAAKNVASTATASEDEFSYNTADLEESSILDDDDFEDEDFEMGEGDEL